MFVTREGLRAARRSMKWGGRHPSVGIPSGSRSKSLPTRHEAAIVPIIMAGGSRVRSTKERPWPGRICPKTKRADPPWRMHRPLNHSASDSGRQDYLGRMTESMTWMTPLVHLMSVATTFALSTVTLPSVTFTAIDCPCSVLISVALTTLSAVMSPAATW